MSALLVFLFLINFIKVKAIIFLSNFLLLEILMRFFLVFTLIF